MDSWFDLLQFMQLVQEFQERFSAPFDIACDIIWDLTVDINGNYVGTTAKYNRRNVAWN